MAAMPVPNPPLPPSAIDTHYWIETPEGLDLLIRPAGLVVRALAFGIDLALRGVILVCLFLMGSLVEHLGLGFSFLMLFLVNWWYMVLFEVLAQGRSPGKRALGLRVITDRGTPVGWSASLLRNLLRFVDMLPLGYAAGALTSLLHPSFKRLGDMAAGTLVIHDPTPAAAASLPDAEPVAFPFTLTLAEQRAVLAFAERSPTLAPGRAAELANLLAEPLGASDQPAVSRLYGVARSLMGPA